MRRSSCSPQEAALLAGIVASPSALRPDRSTRSPPSARRDLVLARMLEQGYLTPAEYDAGDRRGAARRSATSSRRSEDTRVPVLHVAGSSSRSSTSSAAASGARASRAA